MIYGVGLGTEWPTIEMAMADVAVSVDSNLLSERAEAN